MLTTPRSLVLGALVTLAGCGLPQGLGGGMDYPDLHLGQQAQIVLSPSPTAYSYTFEIPPQGSTRYHATLKLTPTVAGRRFRARLATNCSQTKEQPDEVASTSSPEGIVAFSWSAFTSTQWAQIASDEADPFDLQVSMDGYLEK